MPTPTAQDIITNKSELLTGIAAYTNAYNNYVGCKNASQFTSPFKPTGDATQCTTFTNTDVRFDLSGNIPVSGANASKTLSNLQQDVSNKITTINTALTALSGASYPDDNTIKTNYKNMLDKRSTVDTDLQNLYNIQGSIPNMYAENMDYAIYTGILWTVLATSLIYYVFIKL